MPAVRRLALTLGLLLAAAAQAAVPRFALEPVPGLARVVVGAPAEGAFM